MASSSRRQSYGDEYDSDDDKEFSGGGKQIWSVKATEFYISLLDKYKEKLFSPEAQGAHFTVKNQMWADVTEQMIQAGYQLNQPQCRKKLENLKRGFNNCTPRKVSRFVNGPNGTRKRIEVTTRSWPFYSQFLPIMNYIAANKVGFDKSVTLKRAAPILAAAQANGEVHEEERQPETEELMTSTSRSAQIDIFGLNHGEYSNGIENGHSQDIKSIVASAFDSSDLSSIDYGPSQLLYGSSGSESMGGSPHHEYYQLQTVNNQPNTDGDIVVQVLDHMGIGGRPVKVERVEDYNQYHHSSMDLEEPQQMQTLTTLAPSPSPMKKAKILPMAPFKVTAPVAVAASTPPVLVYTVTASSATTTVMAPSAPAVTTSAPAPIPVVPVTSSSEDPQLQRPPIPVASSTSSVPEPKPAVPVPVKPPATLETDKVPAAHIAIAIKKAPSDPVTVKAPAATPIAVKATVTPVPVKKTPAPTISVKSSATPVQQKQTPPPPARTAAQKTPTPSPVQGSVVAAAPAQVGSTGRRSSRPKKPTEKLRESGMISIASEHTNESPHAHGPSTSTKAAAPVSVSARAPTHAVQKSKHIATTTPPPLKKPRIIMREDEFGNPVSYSDDDDTDDDDMDKSTPDSNIKNTNQHQHNKSVPITVQKSKQNATSAPPHLVKQVTVRHVHQQQQRVSSGPVTVTPAAVRRNSSNLKPSAKGSTPPTSSTVATSNTNKSTPVQTQVKAKAPPLTPRPTTASAAVVARPPPTPSPPPPVLRPEMDHILVEELQGVRHEVRAMNRNLERLVEGHNRMHDTLERFLTTIRMRLP